MGFHKQSPISRPWTDALNGIKEPMMADTSFTPGPWAVDYIDGENCIYWELYAIPDDWALADIHGTGGKMNDAANAALIAAAPELYAALENIVDGYSLVDFGVYTEEGGYIAQARAVLAKARGE